MVEVSQFLESDLHGAGSFGLFGTRKSRTGSFSLEPVPWTLQVQDVDDDFPDLSNGLY